MKKILPVVLVVALLLVFLASRLPKGALLSPLGKIPSPRPLDKYSFENLQKRAYIPSEITLERVIKKNVGYTTWLFSFKSDGLKVTGAANIPDGLSRGNIIMLHGFVEKEIYHPGFGTENVAAAFTRNGYSTYAPDFLGYGGSDKPSPDVFEERFQTYTTILNLIASLKSPVGIWAHSNGGQIALSVLAISGKSIPAVLWNPVSKPFPYNILYYTDQFEDNGKSLRRVLAKFEATYDVEKYSTPNYFSRIKAPILLQQGGADTEVPQRWSDQLNENLKLQIVNYVVYSGADHNLQLSWNQAVTADLEFFQTEL